VFNRDFVASLALTVLAGAAGTMLANNVDAEVARPASPQEIQTDAEMQVIFDSGKALPLGPYVSYLLAGVDQQGVLDGLRFPWASRLEVGVLQADAIEVFGQEWMTHPMFIVGTDTASAKWLVHNLSKLSEMGAWGMVVQANNADAFKALQTIADGLPLAPVQSPWLEQILLDKGIRVYPLLVQLNGEAIQILPSSSIARVRAVPPHAPRRNLTATPRQGS
jgi:integrating conjugative element protein (TIGR03765 family)